MFIVLNITKNGTDPVSALYRPNTGSSYICVLSSMGE